MGLNDRTSLSFDTEEVVFSDSAVTVATQFVSWWILIPSKGVAGHILLKEGGHPLSVDAPRGWVGWHSGTSTTKGSGLWSSKECLWRINESSKSEKQTYHNTWGDLHSCWCFSPLGLCTRCCMHHWMCVLYLSSQSAKLFLAVSHRCLHSYVQCQTDSAGKESRDPIRYDGRATLLSAWRSQRARPFHSQAGEVPPTQSISGHSLFFFFFKKNYLVPSQWSETRAEQSGFFFLKLLLLIT